MKPIASWKFVKKVIPFQERVKPKNQLPIFHISPFGFVRNGHMLGVAHLGEAGTSGDESERILNYINSMHIDSDIVLVTGDGNTLQDDVKRFEGLIDDFKYDLFCINRSLLYFERPVNHWAAIDAEESIWFAENYNPRVKMPLRHTIGYCPAGYDVFWKVDQQFENRYQKDIWAGNSGYFGILAAMRMGYSRIVLAGMPLNTGPHWYENQDAEGPNWVGQTYRTWMDCKRKHPMAYKVRSMSEYSQFIFGSVTTDWLLG